MVEGKGASCRKTCSANIAPLGGGYVSVRLATKGPLTDPGGLASSAVSKPTVVG